MRKFFLLLILLLVSCNTIEGNHSVFINSSEVSSISDGNEIYVDIDALAQLNIDILHDAEKSNVYLSSGEIFLEVSNDRPYNWYIDQGETGIYGGNNCGPSSAVMAGLWQNRYFNSTPQEARGLYRSDGGWWYTSDIEDFFEDKNVIYEKDDYDDYVDLIQALDGGHIVLLCIDTSYLTERDETDDYIGKFYEYKGGHFLLVKGYVYIDGELYFEVYDSNCWGETYTDGSPKGKDRLYLEEELTEAIETWWDNYFIIMDLE